MCPTPPKAPPAPNSMSELARVHFENTFVTTLPGDPEAANFVRQAPGSSFSKVQPAAVRAPKLLAWSQDCAALLGLDRPANDADPAVQILAGNRLAPGMDPYAARYGGHQFGTWAGQLGDGRAITLGEMRAPAGGRWELQLKGAGPTPYSRTADGRAVLRSSVREFLCSEAMHWLGVPTTRALSLVGTGETVVRDMFYDGHPRAEPGAIVCRVAPTFVRFGNFEIHASRGESAALRLLADYVIAQHFPELKRGPGLYGRWYEAVCRRTALLLAHWMRVGFVHGVMNTDNMSILGLTLDYGPYGWLDAYDPDWTPNTTDLPGRRYAFGRQPEVAAWNLARLAGALHPLIGDAQVLEHGIELFAQEFTAHWRAMLAAKLGLNDLEAEGDESLVDELFGLLQQVETDMTIFFRALALVSADDPEPLRPAFYSEAALQAEHRSRLSAWLDRYRLRLARDGLTAEERRERMNRVNPRFVLRNYLAQQAIDAASEGDTAPIERLMRVLSRPYDEQPGESDLAMRRPDWARDKPGCSALSCSS